jgi:hypothetical protein
MLAAVPQYASDILAESSRLACGTLVARLPCGRSFVLTAMLGPCLARGAVAAAWCLQGYARDSCRLQLASRIFAYHFKLLLSLHLGATRRAAPHTNLAPSRPPLPPFASVGLRQRATRTTIPTPSSTTSRTASSRSLTTCTQRAFPLASTRAAARRRASAAASARWAFGRRTRTATRAGASIGSRWRAECARARALLPPRAALPPPLAASLPPRAALLPPVP